MDKLCIVILILGLMIGMNSCGRSTEKSETSRSIEKAETELNAFEREIEEGEMFEEETMAPEEEIGGKAEVPDEEWDYDNESEFFE